MNSQVVENYVAKIIYIKERTLKLNNYIYPVKSNFNFQDLGNNIVISRKFTELIYYGNTLIIRILYNEFINKAKRAQCTFGESSLLACISLRALKYNYKSLNVYILYCQGSLVYTGITALMSREHSMGIYSPYKFDGRTFN